MNYQQILRLGVCVLAAVAALTMFSGQAKSDTKRINRSEFCMAKNLYFEARNQPIAGQIAVAHVVLNRVADERFPNNICDVVHEAVRNKQTKMPIKHKCQFSWFCDGRADDINDLKAFRHAHNVATIVMNRSFDITDGALWYHTNGVSPKWKAKFKRTVIINDHVFYRNHTKVAHR